MAMSAAIFSGSSARTLARAFIKETGKSFAAWRAQVRLLAGLARLAGGEKVTFLAGGIINAGSMYTDSLKASTTATLTNAWAPYSIDLTGQTYSSVLGAFGWTMVATDAGASGTFFVDDIQWQ